MTNPFQLTPHSFAPVAFGKATRASWIPFQGSGYHKSAPVATLQEAYGFPAQDMFILHAPTQDASRPEKSLLEMYKDWIQALQV
jgi:hypothetical protein